LINNLGTLASAKQAQVERLFNDLWPEPIRKRAQKHRDFEVLLTNLLYHKQRRPISISLNRNDWTPRPRYRKATYFTIEGALQMLQQHGYVEVCDGYGHQNHTQAQRTKIWPTEKLLAAFAPIRAEDCIFEPVDLVNLRDKKQRCRSTTGTLGKPAMCGKFYGR